MTRLPDLNRRQFLLRAGLISLAGMAPRISTADSRLAFQPAAFDARVDAVLIWVGHDRPARVQIEYREHTATGYVRGPLLELSESNAYCNHARLSGLPAGRSWEYRVVDPQTRHVLSATGRFKTAPAAPTTFSFVFSADISEDYRPYTLFAQMAHTRPDFFLLLGDSAYADYPREHFKPSLAYYRGKHASIRQDVHLQEFLSQHVTYAVWDDHEVENNFHAQHPHLAQGLQAFRDYWPCLTETSDALYRCFTWGGVDFFVLDTRRYRSPQAMEDGPAKTMLGTEQKAWFKTALRASATPFKFVITSVPFHGGGSDTWGNYATERDELEWFIQQEDISGVIFLTGDYHLAREFDNDLTGLREFMAGPIASFAHFKRLPQRREIYRSQGGFFYGDGPNFGYWNVDARARLATLEYLDIQGQSLFKMQISVEQK